MFVGYQNQVEKSLRGKTPLRSLSAYCDTMGLDPEVMLDLCEVRESAIEEMILAGLNPFWGESFAFHKSKEPKKQIQALKRCLFDAFRGNLLTPRFSPRSHRAIYYNNHRLPVRVGERQRTPNAILTPLVTIIPVQPKRTSMEQKHPPLKWELQAALVSVLDTGEEATSVAQAPDLTSPRA